MAAKQKRLTQKEKRERMQSKKRLQEQGIIPPDKPKLNRKKFIKETMEMWNNKEAGYLYWEIYLVSAFGYVMALRERNFSMSKEAVGAAKVLRIALRLKEFHEKLEEEGKETYKVTEEYDYIKDILDA